MVLPRSREWIKASFPGLPAANNFPPTVSGQSVRRSCPRGGRCDPGCRGKNPPSDRGGNVSVRVKGPSRGVQVESSGGDIKLIFPPSVAGNIDAESVGGVVTCFLPGRLAGEIGENELDAKVN